MSFACDDDYLAMTRKHKRSPHVCPARELAVLCTCSMLVGRNMMIQILMNLCNIGTSINTPTSPSSLPSSHLTPTHPPTHSLAMYPILAAPLQRLHDPPHPLVHRKHDRLPGRDAEHARGDALVERPHALLAPHLARDRRDALERRLARDRLRFLQSCCENRTTRIGVDGWMMR